MVMPCNSSRRIKWNLDWQSHKLLWMRTGNKKWEMNINISLYVSSDSTLILQQNLDKGPSEKRTACLERTVLNVPKLSFPIAIIHFWPPRRGQPLYSGRNGWSRSVLYSEVPLCALNIRFHLAIIRESKYFTAELKTTYCRHYHPNYIRTD